MNDSIKILTLTIQDAPVVFDWVMRLLVELGEEGDELGELDAPRLLTAWRSAESRFRVYIAKTEQGEIAGILTLMEAFAIYANGNYGIIDEMYVDPQFRSEGVGAKLINAAKEYGSSRGWARIDVTAPESDRWERTRKFYAKQGFVFAGPKLKFLLKRN